MDINNKKSRELLEVGHGSNKKTNQTYQILIALNGSKIMKLIRKSIFAVAKSLFSKAVEVIDNAFTGSFMIRVWDMYREERDKLMNKDEDLDWGIKRKSYLLSYCIRFVKQVVKFEEDKTVYFKKVGDDVTVHVRKIVTGVLPFKAIGCGLYRFVDADAVEGNGGDIKGAIRSFKIENICLGV